MTPLTLPPVSRKPDGWRGPRMPGTKELSATERTYGEPANWETDMFRSLGILSSHHSRNFSSTECHIQNLLNINICVFLTGVKGLTTFQCCTKPWSVWAWHRSIMFWESKISSSSGKVSRPKFLSGLQMKWIYFRLYLLAGIWHTSWNLQLHQNVNNLKSKVRPSKKLKKWKWKNHTKLCFIVNSSGIM